ncbi:MAG: methyltransferase dimerization domain-containing protein, partial [Polyangiaceae bacterium]
MSDDAPNGFEIGRLMMSMWVPQALHAAAELGVADALADMALDAGALAARLGTHGEATQRLLEALCVLNVVTRGDQGYALTPLGQFLRSDVEGSRRAWSRLMGGADVWRAWGRLIECVRTGEAAYAVGENRRTETETFDALFADPTAAGVFHRDMADGTRGQAAGIIDALELPEGASLVDVGGGFGALLCAALERD